MGTRYAAHDSGLLIIKSELVVNPALNLLTRPKAIAIERNKGELVIEWSDQHTSAFPLRWLRANCPCATCREERRSAALESDILKLSSGPLPSMQIADATLVGNYAIRLVWTDGHDAGIYAFSLLRGGCPCASCHPNGLPKFLLEG